MSGPAFDEGDCLALDPFEGDFGTPGDRVLSDRIVKAAKPHLGICHDCAGDIQRGERHRSRVDIADGEFFTFRWCGECCVAMAKSWEDDGRAMEERVKLGRQRKGMPHV